MVEGGHWSVQYKWEDHETYQHWTIRRTPAGHMLMGWGEGLWGRSDRAAMKMANNATLEKS